MEVCEEFSFPQSLKSITLGTLKKFKPSTFKELEKLNADIYIQIRSKDYQSNWTNNGYESYDKIMISSANP